jgi:D-sedoheptulose 7-phosphate isomerase
VESFHEIIENQLRASAELKRKMADTVVDSMLEVIETVIHALQSGGKVLLCGNGGSAADSQHIAAELVGRFKKDRKGMPAIALTTDTSILTSVANDFGYEEIFRRQVEALGEEGDVLIGISTSGRSRNVVLAIQKAREMGIVTIALIGEATGSVSDAADITVSIPSPDTPRIQEGHITFGHILCDLVERAITK